MHSSAGNSLNKKVSNMFRAPVYFPGSVFSSRYVFFCRIYILFRRCIFSDVDLLIDPNLLTMFEALYTSYKKQSTFFNWPKSMMPLISYIEN